MGHNDICTNTTSKTSSCGSADEDPNNYCRTINAAFEREFRRGMDQLIQIPSVRIGVSALARVSELCNFTGKSGCGLAGFGSCQDVWGLVNICASLTTDCSDTRRIDAYNTAVGYNEILQRVTSEARGGRFEFDVRRDVGDGRGQGAGRPDPVLRGRVQLQVQLGRRLLLRLLPPLRSGAGEDRPVRLGRSPVQQLDAVLRAVGERPGECPV